MLPCILKPETKQVSLWMLLPWIYSFKHFSHSSTSTTLPRPLELFTLWFVSSSTQWKPRFTSVSAMMTHLALTAPWFIATEVGVRNPLSTLPSMMLRMDHPAFPPPAPLQSCQATLDIPGAPLNFNGAPGNIQGNLTAVPLYNLALHNAGVKICSEWKCQVFNT